MEFVIPAMSPGAPNVRPVILESAPTARQGSLSNPASVSPHADPIYVPTAPVPAPASLVSMASLPKQATVPNAPIALNAQCVARLPLLLARHALMDST